MSQEEFGLGPPEEEHDENGELWLISYADMMTLLFGFFVVMYSFAEQGGGLEKLKESLSTQFEGEYDAPLKDLQYEIEKGVKEVPLLSDVKVERTSNGLVLTFENRILFQSGKADLMPEAREALDYLVAIIHQNAPGNPILVEGHTDHRKIQTRRYPSNWELSGARASRVLRLFIDRGMHPRQLTAIGYGDARPVFPNKNPYGDELPKNMAKNRRVVIKVLYPKAFGKKNSE